MSQHDYNIADQTTPNYRQDHNNSLAAIQSLNSGSSAPTNTTPGMLWYDTSNDLVKTRNNDDTGWLPLASLSNNRVTTVFSSTYTLSEDDHGKTLFIDLAQVQDTVSIDLPDSVPIGTTVTIFFGTDYQSERIRITPLSGVLLDNATFRRDLYTRDDYATIIKRGPSDYQTISRYNSYNENNWIDDTFRNELLVFQASSSAVNELRISNASTGLSPTLEAQGDDTDVGLSLDTKGSGLIDINGSTGVNTIVDSGGTNASQELVTRNYVDNNAGGSGDYELIDTTTTTGVRSVTVSGVFDSTKYHAYEIYIELANDAHGDSAADDAVGLQWEHSNGTIISGSSDYTWRLDEDQHDSDTFVVSSDGDSNARILQSIDKDNDYAGVTASIALRVLNPHTSDALKFCAQNGSAQLGDSSGTGRIGAHQYATHTCSTTNSLTGFKIIEQGGDADLVNVTIRTYGIRK